MTTPIEPTADDELQFDTAEPVAAAPAAQACARCGRPITGEYFALRNHVLCPDCRVALEPPPPGNPATRGLIAFGLGLGAGLVGALIWYAVRKATNMEIGLIAVLVGFMVGKAVRYGSGNRGGPGYGVMAVILTYCCIAANYIPDLVQAVIEANHGRAIDGAHLIRVSLLVGRLALELPFLGGAQNILGLLIIGFAMWEAWKFNRRVALPITGPFRVAGPPPMVSGSVV